MRVPVRVPVRVTETQTGTVFLGAIAKIDCLDFGAVVRHRYL